MGILNLIVATASAASFESSSKGGVTSTQWNGQATSWIDFAITVAICATVCISLWILVRCISTFASSKRNDVKELLSYDNNNQNLEKNKDSIKAQDRYDAAWRFFNMCWKIEHPDLIKDYNGKLGVYENAQKLTPEDIARYEESWSVVREYIEAK